MIKKLLPLALVCSVGMSYAAKVRMVTLTAREIQMVQRAHELAAKNSKQASVVAKYAQKVAQGQITMTKEERDELMHHVMFQLARDAKLNRMF